MTKEHQPEALRLADRLCGGDWYKMPFSDMEAAGRELRRLQAENEQLRAQVAQSEAPTGPQPSAILPAFIGTPKRKLDELLDQGFQVSGFAIERQAEGARPQRGFITTDGLVGWWQPDTTAELERLRAQVEALTKLSVTNVMLDVVPGYDGEGCEVFAKSVAEVEEALGRLGLEVEDWRCGIKRLQPEPLTRPAVPEHVREAQAAVARDLEVYHRVADRRRAALPHPDDIAIDGFAADLKVKMAGSRAKGRSGWETCPPELLSKMLREHVEKGDPRDVAIISMMHWYMGAGIAPQPEQATRPAVQVGSWSWLRGVIGGLAKHRHKMEGTGQTHTFVVLDDVLGWVDEGEKRAKLVAPQPEAYATLTPDEVRDLTCMYSGAPWPDAYLASLGGLIAIYEQLRGEGKRPVDPATVPERCTSCDGTGDVTDQIGEWRGYCICEAGQSLKAQKGGA
ncbi:hypothetical protein PSQ39_21260 [Curvibacter sp. HBC28]|uniref:Uncharacterized protein n=1 Tax=Curvibacter microcysteis TaxID=3026419 RepID=A0ABT5MKR7_9BURK|nr:hypothetical protein [Curvibacter sp. HBC28]MDD0817177.1 hypothetical protein [Curvibacter sp. HBC28]